MLECLRMLLFVCDRIPGVRSVLLRVSRVLQIVSKAHLGGLVAGTWGYTSVVHWFATQAQRIIRLFMLETSVCSHKLLWALA